MVQWTLEGVWTATSFDTCLDPIGLAGREFHPRRVPPGRPLVSHAPSSSWAGSHCPVLQPRGSASLMSWRENHAGQPVEAGSFHPHSPLEVHLLACATLFCSGSRRVLSRGAVPWHGLCRSPCCCPIAQLHPVQSPGPLPKDVWIASRVWLRIESAITISAHSLHRQWVPSLSGEYL